MAVFQIIVQAKLVSPTCFYDLQSACRRWQASLTFAKSNICKTAPTWALCPSCRATMFRSCCCPPQCSPVVRMRRPPPAAAAAAALAVLSVLLRLDVSSAQQPKTKHSGRNGQSDWTRAPKRNQPHIVFILIDDQVGQLTASHEQGHVCQQTVDYITPNI